MTQTIICSQTTIQSQTGTAKLWADPSTLSEPGAALAQLAKPDAYSFTVAVPIGIYDLGLFATGDPDPFWAGAVNIQSENGVFYACDSRFEAMIAGGSGTLTGISTAGVIALRNALTGVNVTSVGLVDDSGGLSIPLVQGDTYEAATGTGIPVPCPNAGLVGWTPELAIDVAGKVVVVTATAITDWSLPIYFDMTAVQSSSLPTGVDGTCVLRFTKSGKTHTTTVNGRVTVTARIG